jgi:hypothetical protein
MQAACACVLCMRFDSSHRSAAAYVLINHIQFKVGRECLLNYLSLAQKRISLDSIKGLLESREPVCSGDVTVICVCKGGGWALPSVRSFAARRKAMPRRKHMCDD